MTTQFYMHSDEEIPEDERHSVTAPRQPSISVMQLPNVCLCVLPLLSPIPYVHSSSIERWNLYFPPDIMCGFAGVADWTTCCLSYCCVVVEFGLLPSWNLLFKEPATCGYLCWPRRRY